MWAVFEEGDREPADSITHPSARVHDRCCVNARIPGAMDSAVVCAVRGLQPRSHGYAHRSHIFGSMIWVRSHGTIFGVRSTGRAPTRNGSMTVTVKAGKVNDFPFLVGPGIAHTSDVLPLSHRERGSPTRWVMGSRLGEEEVWMTSQLRSCTRAWSGRLQCGDRSCDRCRPGWRGGAPDGQPNNSTSTAAHSA